LSFRDALVPGQIGVGAYVTKAREDKFLAQPLALSRSVLEQQPAPCDQMLRRAAHESSQRRECILARREREPRLMPQVNKSRIIARDVGRIAHQQIEAFRTQG
jgi:hypothetical protein